MVVRTGNELKQAINNREQYIRIENPILEKMLKPLAYNQLNNSQRGNLANVSPMNISGMAAITGLETIVLIIISVLIGGLTLYALMKDYNVYFKLGFIEIELKNNSSNDKDELAC